MSWWARLRGRRYRKVRDPRVPTVGQWIEIDGVASVDRPLVDPVEQRPAVALEVRVWPPPTTVGVDGTMAAGARAFQVVLAEAVDFTLVCGGYGVQVRVAPGEDVGRRYAQLLARHGVGLRAEVTRVSPGARVRVLGRVLAGFRDVTRSPHRREPWVMEMAADRLLPLAQPDADLG